MLLPDLYHIVQHALQEDIGTGDITTLTTVPAGQRARAVMVAKSSGVVAGLPLIAEVYRQVDENVSLEFRQSEGAKIEPGDLLCELRGDARSLLTGERVALNFVQRLSGIATKTAQFARLMDGTGARLCDTRKTTPGLRALEKYAVRAGGGHNHRFGLYDAVLIKDNHIQASGGIAAAVWGARAQMPHTMTITVECDTLEQVDEALAARADIILLDNMTLEQLRTGVAKIHADGHTLAEASGGVNETTLADIAATGVDIVSVGALTHSAIALDIGLDLTLE